ncbi:MAG TPA: methyl-accepting chemotaxis protein [Albitalea sp.]|nr:methyl-accepting chemotaxis protein [Albitalea sp.]
MQLSRLRIGPRLLIAFGGGLLMALAMGLYAIAQLSSVNGATERIATHSLPSIALAGRLQDDLNRLRRLEDQHVLTFDAEEKEEVQKRMTAQQQRLHADLPKYEALLQPGAGRTAFGEFKTLLAAYEATGPKTLELSNVGMTRLSDARAYLLGPSKETFTRASDALAKLVQISEAEGEASFAGSQQAYQQSRMLVFGWLLAMLAAGITMAPVITRSIVRPLRQAAQAADQVAAGDLSAELVVQGRDETADLMRAVVRMQGALRSTIGRLCQAAQSISNASAEIASGNQDLSSRTEQAAANLQQAASSMEELTGTVKQSADSASLADRLALSAAEVAARGGTVVSQVVATMDDINASSKKIADIIGVIDGIAFQTNILALNAAVEAARAGEQGRGFAVVAGEVRNLAQRSAEAAKEIKALIGASVDKVESGSKLVADAGKTMQEIVSSVQRVTDIIGEITAAASEQSDGIGQVNTAVTQLDQMTQQNAALVEQSAAAAESLKQQAQTLARAVDTFKVDAASHRAAVAAQAPIVAAPRTAPDTPKPRAKHQAAPPIASTPAPVVTAPAHDEEWETF